MMVALGANMSLTVLVWGGGYSVPFNQASSIFRNYPNSAKKFAMLQCVDGFVSCKNFFL